TAATMAHSLEAALVFSDNAAAAETLATLGRQGQFSAAEVRDKNGRAIASWRYDARAADDKLIGLISHWLFPLPVSQPVWHNGRAIGEVRLVAR
ncbi:CHASE sensor domain-containing protein, partial [Salmonella enterica]